jgi:hypothetical protein
VVLLLLESSLKTNLCFAEIDIIPQNPKLHQAIYLLNSTVRYYHSIARLVVLNHATGTSTTSTIAPTLSWPRKLAVSAMSDTKPAEPATRRSGRPRKVAQSSPLAEPKKITAAKNSTEDETNSVPDTRRRSTRLSNMTLNTLTEDACHETSSTKRKGPEAKYSSTNKAKASTSTKAKTPTNTNAKASASTFTSIKSKASSNTKVNPFASEPIGHRSARIASKQKLDEEHNEEAEEAPTNIGSKRKHSVPKQSGRPTKQAKIDSADETFTPKIPGRTPKKSGRAGAETATRAAPVTPKIRGAFAKKQKAKGYGITFGVSPYPDHAEPTLKQCNEVVDILAEYHGDRIPPKAVPPPSLTRAGCGDVPAVHDALLRTRLSAATTTENAANALDNLVKVYGVAEAGVGKGSINWDAVRMDTKEKLFDTIKTGGLGEVKSTDIKATLDRIYKENQERCAKIVADGGALADEVS